MWTKATFDPAKNTLNLEKHGLPLIFGQRVLQGATASFEDTRFDYGERRFVTFGYVTGRLYVVVYSKRGDETRLISVRKANAREQQRYGTPPPSP